MKPALPATRQATTTRIREAVARIASISTSFFTQAVSKAGFAIRLGLAATLLSLACPAFAVQLMTDPHVQTGAVFEKDNGPIEGTLQYTNIYGTPIWELAQYYVMSISNNVVTPTVLPTGAYRWTNAHLGIVMGPTNTTNSDFSFKLDSIAVFTNKYRTSGSAPFPGLIMSQSISAPGGSFGPYGPWLADLSELVFHADVRMNSITNVYKSGYNSSIHAAQFPIYFTVQNLNPPNADYGKYLWFGIMVYDDRIPITGSSGPQWVGLDAGTGMGMYQIGIAQLSTGALTNVWKALNGDILTHVKNGLQAAWAHNYLTNSTNFADYKIGGMNIGWEVPGLSRGEMQVQNLGLEAYGANFARTYEFNTNGQTDGWSLGNMTDVNGGATNGVWVVNPGTSAVPIMMGPATRINTSLYKKVVIRMANVGNTGNPAAQIYWKRSRDAGFSEACSQTVVVGTDGSFADYTFDMSANANWTEEVVQLRFDPVMQGNNGNISVDYIRPVAIPSTWIKTLQNGVSGTWTNSDHWLGNTVPNSPGATANFTALDIAENVTVTLDGTQTAGGVYFKDLNASHNLTLASGNGGTLNMSRTNGKPVLAVTNGVLVVDAPIAGTNGLLKTGVLGYGYLGIMAQLNGTNTYSGGTDVAGDISVGSDRAFGTGTVAFGDVVGADQVSVHAANGDRTITNSVDVRTIRFHLSPYTIAGKAPNNLTLSGSVNLNQGGANVRDFVLERDLTLSGTVSGGPAGLRLYYGNLTLLGNNTFANHVYFTTYDGCRLTINANAALGAAGNQVYLYASATLQAAAGSNVTLPIGRNINIMVSGKTNIFDVSASSSMSVAGVVDGAGGLVSKTGTGSLTLSGVNTYSGTTTVSAGTLLVNSPGSLAAGSAVTVSNGATLGGNGTINGATTVNGVVSPGTNGSGTLTFQSSLTLNSGASALFQINTTNAPATNDYVVVSGALNVTSGVLTVTNLGPAPAGGSSFKLFSKAVSGFTTVNWPTLPTGRYWTNRLATDGTIAVSNVTYTLNYLAGANGSISGATPQTVSHGTSGTAVTAVSETGYAFVNWTDGSVANPRTDASVTNNVTVTANFSATPPAISALPTNLTVTAGQPAGFAVTATGAAPLSYRWWKGGTPVAGATSANYSFANARLSDAGGFTVVVTNVAGSITSSPVATLTVLAPEPPAISTVRQLGGQFIFTFTPVAGLTNTVLTNGVFAAAGWSVLTNVPAPATTNIITISDPATGPARFYRVQIIPW